MSTTKLTLCFSFALSICAVAAPVETTQHYWYSPEFGPEFNTSVYEPEPLRWKGDPTNPEAAALTNQPSATSIR